MSQKSCTLIKVGGSLYDLPDLGGRLRILLTSLVSECVILFPGGGAVVDVVRELDRVHGLGQKSSHWLALRALTLNAYFLQTLLPEYAVTCGPDVPNKAIIEPYAFALADDKMPHTWDVTSDSLAARAACILGAQELILLKSTDVTAEWTWQEAAQKGIVDPFFSKVLPQSPGLKASVVNLRSAYFAVGHVSNVPG